MSPDRPYFFDLDPPALERIVTRLRMPAYRAQQIMRWVYQRSVADPHEMTDLSKADRQLLAEQITFTAGTVAQHQRASDDTQKLLISWPASPNNPKSTNHNPQLTECVMIPSDGNGSPRRTGCISSQVGCPVGCRFCASGLGGLEANLTAGQIVEQVHWLNRRAGSSTSPAGYTGAVDGPARRKHITNVVFMGMGEPLCNFEHVTRAVRTLRADWAFGLSARRITISTVGLPAQMRRLGELDLPVTLAISLHAPDDELRRRLIPWAERTSIDAILDAARFYFERTGREITFEYVLLRDVNDRPEHARQLARLVRPLRCNVNLIRYNEVKGLPFDRPATDDVHRFQQILQRAGVNTHLRASRGRDIAAACGQLRREASENHQ